MKHGGLALVNIHPDYIDFEGNSRSSTRYPSALVEEFIEFARTEYEGMYWNPLARELALWYQNEIHRTTAADQSRDYPQSPENR
jgi:hypothetical protein